MKIRYYLLCALSIIIGICCTVGLVNLFDVQSGAYGKAIVLDMPSEYDEYSKFDYGTIGFDSDDMVHYRDVTTFGYQEFDGNKDSYTLFFNDRPLVGVTQAAGHIGGDLVMKFKDVDGVETATVSVTFLVEYLSNATRVTITAENNNDGLSYFETYMMTNGAILRVMQGGK